MLKVFSCANYQIIERFFHKSLTVTNWATMAQKIEVSRTFIILYFGVVISGTLLIAILPPYVDRKRCAEDKSNRSAPASSRLDSAVEEMRLSSRIRDLPSLNTFEKSRPKRTIKRVFKKINWIQIVSFFQKVKKALN